MVLAHVGRLTGRSFFLAKSGAQAGKAASKAGYGATYVDIECKRYRRGKSPTARELIGGFDEAIDARARRLDLWLVVSTGAIGSREAEALQRKADREAVAVEIIDWQAAGLPQLAVLCASRLLNWMEQVHPDEWVGVGGINFHYPLLIILEKRGRIHVEQMEASVSKLGLCVPAPGQTEHADEFGWQGQGAGEAGINDSLNLMLLPLRAAHDKVDGCRKVRVDDANDHAGLGTKC